MCIVCLNVRVIACKYFQHWWNVFLIHKQFWKCLEVCILLSGNGYLTVNCYFLKMSMFMLITSDHFHFSFQLLILFSYCLNLICTQTAWSLFPGSFPWRLHVMALPGALSMKWHGQLASCGQLYNQSHISMLFLVSMGIEIENVKKSNFSSGLTFKSVYFNLTTKWIWCSFLQVIVGNPKFGRLS